MTATRVRWAGTVRARGCDGAPGAAQADEGVRVSERVHVERAGRLAIVEMDGPHGNSLSLDLRAALVAALADLAGHDDLDAVVLTGRGRLFSSGQELRDHDEAPAAPTLQDLCAAIEEFPRPVVAALHGVVVGAGVALALAAHARVVAPGTRIALPEVRLGLVPGGGATQRLPRLAGADRALGLMLTGTARPLPEGVADPLVDAVAGGDLRAAALAHAESLAGTEPRRTADRGEGVADAAAFTAAIARARAARGGHGAGPDLGAGPDAAALIVDAVEAAQLFPFESGLAFEAEVAETCRASDVSAALRHVFAARMAARDFVLPETLREVHVGTVAVLGGGPLAVQLVPAALDAGLAVRWGSRDPSTLRDGLDAVREAYARREGDGAPDPAEVAARLDRLTLGDSAAMAEGADLAVQAARGQGDVPVPADVPRIEAVPGWVEGVGLRVALPLALRPLVEVLAGPLASAEGLAAARALVLALGKVPLKVVSDGLGAADRLGLALHRAADALVDAGAAPAEIDAALVAAGWRRPPFEARDRAGLGAFAGAPRGPGARNWSALLCEVGLTGGGEAGQGFYRHGPDGVRPSEAAVRLIDGTRAPAPMAAAEIVERIVAALANEGARMLEAGMLRRPAEVDVAAVLGLDVPRASGGPMMAADLAGLWRMKRALERFEHPDRGFWDPLPIWGELAKNGRGFGSLNG